MYKVLLVLFFIFFQNTFTSGQANCCTDLSGENLNYQPDEEKATTMRLYFDSLYARDNDIKKRRNPLRDSFWISKSLVDKMVDLHSRNKSICGYRFSYNMYDPWIGPDKMFLAITPTSRDSGYVEYVGRRFKKPETKSMNVNYNVKKRRFGKRGKKFHKKFERYYTDNSKCKNDTICLSKSVWFDRCLINKIAADIDSIGGDGLAVFSIAYADQEPGLEESQHAKNQSSFILVATQSGGKTVAWGKPKFQNNDVLENSSLKKEGIESVQAASSAATRYNHGELCPQKCPDRTIR